MNGFTETKGGKTAHIARRLIHLSIIFIPILYYFFLIPTFLLINLHITIIVFLLVVVLLDLLRMKLGMLFFGQRQYEAKRFSSFAWTVLSVGVVLLFSPSSAFSFAIIGSCAIVDPVMGELRAHAVQTWQTVLVGVCIVLCVWLAVAYYYQLSYAWAFFMAPLTAALEWPSWDWIDDNALMMCIPLAIIVGVSA